MNERLNLQDLIDLLAQKQEITKKDAETFLRELVAVISESIGSEDSVKLKDFGTFKLVKVNARKSINVNTGEAFEIPAHYKLSFTPDKQLKEAINRPFAHFESVILEEGVSFENIDTKDEDIDSEDSDIDNVESTESAEEQTTPLVESPIENEKIGISESEEAETVEVEVEDIVQSEATVEIDIEEQETTKVVETSEIEDNSPLEEPIQPKRRKKPSRRKLVSLGFIIFLIIAGFAIGGYFFQDILSYKGNTSPTDNKENIVATDSIAGSITLQPDSVAKVDSSKIDKTTDETENKANTETLKEEKKIDIEKPLTTETIQSGQTMRLISLKYYGHKSFWIYIYQENKSKINNPNNVPIGTSLHIPHPAKYGIDAKNPASIEKAKTLESQLITELGL